VGVGGVTPRAVLLDALGTLVELPPPAPALVEELAARGTVVREAEAAWAIGAEIAFYRAHLHHAGTPEGLAGLRARCTEVLRAALPAHARATDDLQGALLGALRFRAYPEVCAVLERLRAAGARLVVVSNWDASLHEVLDRTGIAPLVDGALASAEVGSAKPDGAIFAAALELAGVAASDAVHVGDSVEADVEGARAAGIAPVLVARDGSPGPAGVPVVQTLEGVGLDG
jgi:putative hydrolase of the HAD superfamily